MGRCEICGNEGTLLWAVIKREGGKWVCPQCWKQLYEDNMMVSGAGESGCGC